MKTEYWFLLVLFAINVVWAIINSLQAKTLMKLYLLYWEHKGD